MRETRNIYSVRQVNAYIRRMFEDDFILKNIYVKGEISNCKYHYSGHIYFSLKDESGVIAAVMFASNASSLRFRLTDGMQVVIYGNISVYERDGRYQLYARRIEQEGQGDLFRRFEELKNRLAESGMFDDMYKKPIPRFSRNIGVVTAETGAVIRDIWNVASRRNPYCQITLYPAKVQGEGAAQTICEGIRRLDSLGLDVIIIGRGGGSIEDLWAFNEESVARAVFQASTPIISAVGHETDFTIADFVADLRAPTPSAAAELAVFDYGRFAGDLDQFRMNLEYYMDHALRISQNRVRNYRLQLEVQSPQNQLDRRKDRLRECGSLLASLMNGRIAQDREQLIALSERLEGLSPLKRLSEGYSFVTDQTDRPVRSVQQVREGDRLGIYVTDGWMSAQVSGIRQSAGRAERTGR